MENHIAESAHIGKNTRLGFNVIVLDQVFVGDDCVIGNNVVIHAGTKIGSGVRIDDNCVIGKEPLRSPRSIFKNDEKFKPAEIGDNTLIGALVTIYTGSITGQNNLIADLATIRENTIIGDYNIIGRNVTVENFCKIGDRNKLETNAYITAYSEIEDYCFIAPCVATSNDNYMGRDPERYKHFKGITMKTGSRIGVNATILPGKTLDNNATVAAGSIVTKDVYKNNIVLGNPAKKIKDVPDAQLYENNLDKR